MNVKEATRLVEHSVMELIHLDAGGRSQPRESDPAIARAADVVIVSARILIDTVRESYPHGDQRDE